MMAEALVRQPLNELPKKVSALKGAVELLSKGGSIDQFGHLVADSNQYATFMNEHFGRTPAEIIARYGIPGEGSGSREFVYQFQKLDDNTGGPTEITLRFSFDGGIVTNAQMSVWVIR